MQFITTKVSKQQSNQTEHTLTSLKAKAFNRRETTYNQTNSTIKSFRSTSNNSLSLF